LVARLAQRGALNKAPSVEQDRGGTAQQRRSLQPIPIHENLSELLMVTDAKLSLQNRC
jgi:hypothetical protein